MTEILLTNECNLTIRRDRHGVPHVEASTEPDLYYGAGYCQAMDRGMQMLLMRILAAGRGSEFLDAGDEMLQFDVFFRRMNWSADVSQQAERISPQIQPCIAAYCAGVNRRFSESIPWELKLLGIRRPEPWTTADSILLSRMIAYVGLQQSQTDIEQFLVQAIHAGIPRPLLEELFSSEAIGEMDEELIRKVTLAEPFVPAGILWNSVIPKCVASNNWSVSGAKTASGRAMLCNDPHLELNRLPNVWQEMALRLKNDTTDRYAIGCCMPGLPGILIGRTNDVAWGATYSFLDGTDSWIEDCRDGKYRRDDEWVAFRVRTEVIKRKKKADHVVTFYENEHGVLDGDPHRPGYYLATRSSAAADTGSKSIACIMRMLHALTVEQAMDTMGQVESTFNWVFADSAGNIGYQMSGLMPVRRSGVTGMVPVAGWDPRNDWQGFVPHRDLPRAYNPPDGYIVTANNDLNALGVARPINVSMGEHRARRIAELLNAKPTLTVADMAAIQQDVFSLHAQELMDAFDPFLPDTAQGKILREWECSYDVNSQGAYLFENVYVALLREVFGANGFGTEVINHLLTRTSLFNGFFSLFDRVFVSENSGWFMNETRAALFERTIAEALRCEPRPLGQQNAITLNHLVLGGRLPKILGFDKGPVPVKGGRATIHQCQTFTAMGRRITFAPTYRMITDFSEDGLHTALAGGPSDRRFSPWYVSGLERWLSGRYKTLRPDATAPDTGPIAPVDPVVPST